MRGWVDECSDERCPSDSTVSSTHPPIRTPAHPRVKPWSLLGEATAPNGATLALMRHDREYVIFANGKILMSSRMHGSEEALADFALNAVAAVERPHIVIGGLGLGFTLRAALDRLPPEATVAVAELVPAVVEWNRGPLGPLADHPLNDRRATVVVSDVIDVL